MSVIHRIQFLVILFFLGIEMNDLNPLMPGGNKKVAQT